MTHNAIFTVLFILASGIFCYSAWRRLCLIRLGKAENRFDHISLRIWDMLLYAFGQKRVLERPFGVNHFIIFWSFIILLIANGEFIAEGIIPGANLAALLPSAPYRIVTLLFDTVSLAALICVLVALWRRLLSPPSYLGNDYTAPASGEALLILGMIATLMTAFFVMNAAAIAAGTGTAWRPVSGAISALFQGQPQSTLEMVERGAWWVHALVLVLFMNFLPRSKHMHILTAIPNIFLRSLEKPNTQPRETFARGERYGVGSVEQFTRKDLLDSLTCTECGRCQDLCPAHNTGKPLNPRRIVHDIKVNLLENGPAVELGGKGSVPLIGEPVEGTVGEEAIWSCTTCGACTSVCPVLIEQMPKIVKLRRHLVQEKARFPEELLNLFENMEQRSNPWGIAPGERSKWSTLLGDRTYRPGETEYLFFVGCAGAFDSRAKQVTVAMATLLDRAGVSWGILGKEEKCCGDSVRRLGNEYLFDRMAKENAQLLKEKKVSKIVTHCPHCFSTLKNDYRQYGLEIEVIHHSQLLDSLAKSGRLTLPQQKDLGKVIFHDSCYLGRHNDTYLPPRALLTAATGSEPAEFSANRESAFCCGAGGGRMWLEEHTGSRINLERVKDAMEQKPDTICVSCPYCMTMLEDGLKDLGAGDRVRVRDIAEVAAEAVRLAK